MLSESLERLTLRGDEKALRSALKQQQRSSSSSSLYFPLKLAAEHGLLNIVKLFVEEGKCNMNQQDSDHMTPLAMACWRNQLHVVKYLCSFPNIELNIKFTRAENTCLHIAAMYGYFDVVHCLLKHGAEKSLKNYYWRTAEEEALARGYSELASFISRYEIGTAIKLQLKRQVLEQDSFSEYHLSDVHVNTLS
ncbi:hypothetical protein FDP41_010770 [Naegleria fowleri]|uniref:Uncharacterized protein n=1 Tax=Naegleria fowleri TaxID=5763 RepID=A0A6A5C6Q8_NAEFO|nr:uncharacterized protein FDP41_010770 [Naegleria fowleri]KAF0982791.1 hypothetical protein FDP41_010770 [Naegleria fowleri]